MSSAMPNILMRFLALAGLLAILAASVHAEEGVEMAEVRRLARQPVETILAGAPVERLALRDYWSTLAREHRPVIVFFYCNADDESQRVATLIRYVAPRYADRIAFYGLRVKARGKPSAAWADELKRKFQLKNTPGVLFYGNPGQRLTLVQEEYIQADFKTFRSPRMWMWGTYYRVVQRELDKLVAGRS